MPVTVEQLDSRVLLFSIIAPWTVDDLQGVYPQAQEYFDAATDKLFTIVNLTRLGVIPPGALRARVSPFVSHPNSGQILLVGANNFAKTMAEVVFKLTNFRKIMFFQNVDEAWAYIRPLLESGSNAA